tara:strand:- start:1 stop:801 length:801 start_codon:yes stop_codon:yes gene_type:complete
MNGILNFAYKNICKMYEFYSTLYENVFLRKCKSQKSFLRKGIFKLKHPFFADFEKIHKFDFIKVNKYLRIRSFNNNQKEKLILKVFSKEIREQITSITGFCFSIDFMIFYDREFIPLKERKVSTLKQAYSYRWHFDKPNSRNMLKIFIPLNVTKDHGPLEALSREQSRFLNNFKEIKNMNNITLFLSNKDNIYGLNPTVCCHKDGIPNQGKIASQVMFQLNPNRKWVINANLFSRYPSLNSKLGIWTSEPKFPLISYFRDKRIEFN